MVSRSYLTFNTKLQKHSSLHQTTNAGDVSDVDVVEKMPLQNEWTVWEQLENDSHKDYTNNMKPVLKFSTVQVTYSCLLQKAWHADRFRSFGEFGIVSHNLVSL